MSGKHKPGYETARYRTHKEEYKAAAKRWREKNPKAFAAALKRYRKKHAHAIKVARELRIPIAEARILIAAKENKCQPTQLASSPSTAPLAQEKQQSRASYAVS